MKQQGACAQVLLGVSLDTETDGFLLPVDFILFYMTPRAAA
jgi:hypothetical protein